MRVLIVEDSDSICRMIEALVAARGFEVRSAGSGRARASRRPSRGSPHVILLDINLPGAYDGLEVCTKLRADPATKDTPVIIISAMNDDEVKRARRARRRQRLLREAVQPARAAEGDRGSRQEERSGDARRSRGDDRSSAEELEVLLRARFGLGDDAPSPRPSGMRSFVGELGDELRLGRVLLAVGER